MEIDDYNEDSSSLDQNEFGCYNNCTTLDTMVEATQGSLINKTLTPDMQFNSSSIVSISVYSVLFILSAVGMNEK